MTAPIIHLASHSSKPRPNGVLFDLLAERLAWFRRQPGERRAQIDAFRFVPVEDTHAMLAFYLAHGYCADESSFGRPLLFGQVTA